jgi:tetratricopeptide (TPR) repeat protein
MNFFFLVRERKQPQEPVRSRPQRTNRLLLPIQQQRRRNAAANIHFKAGTDYHLDHQYDDAIARYRQAIANDQHFGPAYVNLGLAYLAKNRRREAIRAFRGAVEYADDQKSEQEAWFQLHQLSEVSPTDETSAQASLVEMGAAPWTDIKPRPNWVGLGVSGGLLLLGGLFFYGYLLTSLIEILRT